MYHVWLREIDDNVQSANTEIPGGSSAQMMMYHCHSNTPIMPLTNKNLADCLPVFNGQY